MMNTLFSKDALKPGYPRASISTHIFFLLVVIFLIAGALQAAIASPEKRSVYGKMDLLHSPAQLTDKAAVSHIMDVARTDSRLIAVGERGHILYSNDSGETWTQVKVPVSVTLTAVCFPTPRMGWAVGHDGVILHSEDGGQTWSKQLDGIAINTLMLAMLERVIEATKKRLAEAGEEQRAEIELNLENLEFFLDDVNMAITEGPTRPLMDVWFKNEREGIAIGAFGMILSTSDGGKNWVPLLDRIDNPDGFHYYGICRSADSLFIAGEAGMLFRSDDWGQHWKRLASPYEGTFFGITGSDDGTIVAAYGLRGSLFLSCDGGDTWTQAEYRKGASISGGTFTSDGTLVLGCVDGTIVQSRDRGKTFSVLPTRFPGSIAIVEANDKSLVVAGLRGVTRIKENRNAKRAEGIAK